MQAKTTDTRRKLVKTSLVLRQVAVALVLVLLFAACSASVADIDTSEAVDRGTVTAEFDGTWRSECAENRLFDVPEEDQPEGYVQTILTIDSSTNSYSRSTIVYFGDDCRTIDTGQNGRGSSGDLAFEGVTTTRSGLEATVVRYTPRGTAPEEVGLLYREGDVLYQDVINSTLIEDVVPTDVSLSHPWRLDS